MQSAVIIYAHLFKTADEGRGRLDLGYDATFRPRWHRWRPAIAKAIIYPNHTRTDWNCSSLRPADLSWAVHTLQQPSVHVSRPPHLGL